MQTVPQHSGKINGILQNLKQASYLVLIRSLIVGSNLIKMLAILVEDRNYDKTT